MARVEGDTIIIWQGENPDILFNVVDDDGDPYDLTGGAATFTYWQGSGTAVNVTGVISTTTVTVTIAHATTQLMSGAYEYQLFCRNTGGKMIMTRTGVIQTNISKNPDAVVAP